MCVKQQRARRNARALTSGWLAPLPESVFCCVSRLSRSWCGCLGLVPSGSLFALAPVGPGLLSSATRSGAVAVCSAACWLHTASLATWLIRLPAWPVSQGAVRAALAILQRSSDSCRSMHRRWPAAMKTEQAIKPKAAVIMLPCNGPAPGEGSDGQTPTAAAASVCGQKVCTRPCQWPLT